MAPRFQLSEVGIISGGAPSRWVSAVHANDAARTGTFVSKCVCKGVMKGLAYEGNMRKSAYLLQSKISTRFCLDF